MLSNQRDNSGYRKEMATGIPKTKWSSNNSNPAQADIIPEQSLDVSLSYDGKKTKAEILATTPTVIKLLRRSDEAKNFITVITCSFWPHF